MNKLKKIKTALISVYYKDGLDEIVTLLFQNGVKIYSTGGTQNFIEKLSIPVTPIEELTNYPAILDGRVKTLHPKIFGAILAVKDNELHQAELQKYEIPEIDLVIVDLYPFEETVASGASSEEIIEKIDIGGVSLIRAAAKNHIDVAIISSKQQYAELLSILKENDCNTTLENRLQFALEAFEVTSYYDKIISDYFIKSESQTPPLPEMIEKQLRYGENPHQKAGFIGDFDLYFEQLNGKDISYNNILDIDAAVSLISEFDETTCAILKHNNACGIASRETLVEAWKSALAGDPASAYGGIVISNINVDEIAAQEIDKIFFEIIIAPSYTEEALKILKNKKNRIILIQKLNKISNTTFRDALNGFLIQQRDLKIETFEDFNSVTKTVPSANEVEDLIFANKVVKHSKSNAIVLAKEKQLIGSGVGQTSRVDALKQAILKAQLYDFELNGAVMASDAFFPFVDCAEIAAEVGITAIVQPGGSIRDKETIDFCNDKNIAMVFTGIRHFKH
ncbi:MAG: bifunctional phosphoribosylaminoimidazolecarboxamide formyltransferase/IMP cyclohydrolase [Marinilabiliaceae bacterium]|nr:bifunctional phosphoribosylaminoimidazolecarboxamide formyltransferase/IMP cyclohydrolase [Marinilabiliaceae bacterium]